MPDLNVKIGQSIETQDKKQGIVRYIGPLHIAAGEWLGLELPENSGKNDGSVKGERYFQCAPGYGIFVRKESAVRIVRQLPQSSKPAGPALSNGSTSKPRPSSGVSADVARKRQSLMSGGSASTGGSRLSLRSPTKSPTKPTQSALSSSTSTPRTGTPATTARTSDSSSKSRSSINGRSLMGPPALTTRTGAPTSSRQSMGGTVKPLSAKPTSLQPRQSMGGSRLSMSPANLPQPPKNDDEYMNQSDDQHSPFVEEEEAVIPEIKQANVENSSAYPLVDRAVSPAPSSVQPLSGAPRHVSNISSSVPENPSRQTVVIKKLEAKVRTLQEQRQEDQAQLSNLQELQSKTKKYEEIIKTLREKLKLNQQETSELKAKYDEAESRASQAPEPSAELESELELATLDKEMAEERAGIFEAELEALKLRHEELELEVDILREENGELVSGMNPEERATSGWFHTQQEIERLRNALVMLRDRSEECEAGLKHEIKELQEALDDMKQTATKYEDTVTKLSRAEETNAHLREQLDALETNDEILEVMGAERDQNRHAIENLKRQIQDLEEHIQVTDELEAFHVEEEKRLHHQLDEREALLNERLRQSVEQDKTVEDLEYTLNKFREVVQGLQNDIDELRRSRDISELEAHEMSSKSRAMMDLNLKLQNSAAKTQLKTIDLELGKMRAEQASLHLEIVQLFIPDTFEMDKQPIIALLCFKRIKAKALLCRNVLAERIRDRPELLQDGFSAAFAVLERLNFIANLCDRFVQHMSSCPPEDFMSFSVAPFELEPVEQAMTSWVEALRRDELAQDGADHLHRMAGILVDMAEKLIHESQESKSSELIASVSMVECYTDTIASQAQMLSKVVQSRLGLPADEDDGAVVFDKKMDQLAIKARTIRYVSSKIAQSLGDLRARSMSPGEAMWSLFLEAEQLSEQLSGAVREVTQAVMDDLNQLEREGELSYIGVMDLMTATAVSIFPKGEVQASVTDDIFGILAKPMQSLQSKIDDLNSRSADVNNAIEFEKLPAPWAVRSREVKTKKILSQDLQEEMARLKSRIQEQMIRVGEKDKLLEEQQVKVEVLEARARETKVKDDGVKAMKETIETLQASYTAANEALHNLEAQYQSLLRTQEESKAELESMKQAKMPDGQNVTLGAADESVVVRMKAEADLIKVELASLEAAVRFLTHENHSLRLPISGAAVTASSYTWLNPDLLKPGKEREMVQQIRSESKDVFSDLIQMAKKAKPIKLKGRLADKAASNLPGSFWRPESDTTLYQVLQQKEALEQWNQQRLDLMKRAKVLNGASRGRLSDQPGRPVQRFDHGSIQKVEPPLLEEIDFDTESAGNGVRIVKN